MSQNNFEYLGWGAGGDGASVMVYPHTNDDRPDDDYKDLMGAWSVERGRVVEAELLLSRARRVLAYLIQLENHPSPLATRRIRRLLREIDDQIR